MSDNLYRFTTPHQFYFISLLFKQLRCIRIKLHKRKDTQASVISNLRSLQFFMHQRKFDSTHKLFLSLFLLFLLFKWLSINNSIFLLHKMLQDCHFNKISSYKNFLSFYDNRFPLCQITYIVRQKH